MKMSNLPLERTGTAMSTAKSVLPAAQRPVVRPAGRERSETRMPSTKRIQFTATIKAPPGVVWRHVTDPESYRRWTSAFAEGSCFEGSWEPGARIRFLAPSGDGMVSEIAECRTNEFISIRHLGFMANGVEDTTSEAVRAWAPAYENYTFSPTTEGTTMVVEQDVAAEWEEHLAEAWPKALAILKELSESRMGA